MKSLGKSDVEGGKLLLSRKQFETIKLKTSTGEVIVLTLAKICGNRATVMVQAPLSVSIVRGEASSLAEVVQ